MKTSLKTTNRSTSVLDLKTLKLSIDGKAASNHTHPDASTSAKGLVQLSTATDSTSTTLAATASAVKAAYDKAQEAFQNASDGKTKIAAAITGKGVSASSSDTFQILSDKIGQIKTGFELPMVTPTYEINVGTVNAVCNTQNGLFVKFKLNSGGAWQTSNKFSSLNPVTSYTFYGQTTNGYENSITVTTPKANQSAPSTPTSSNITTNSITITAPSGCKIRYNNTLYNSPYTFSGLTSDTQYTFYSVKEATTTLNQAVSGALTVRTLTDIPGPSSPIQGDTNAGYYGKVNGIVTGSQLISLTGCTSGTLSVSGDITWLKFAYKGKILFVADRNIKTGISWDYLNGLSCVSGKTISINGKSYKCRLIQGGDSDPAYAKGREWDDLIVKFTPNNSDCNWSGIYTMCQEKYAQYANNIVIRGYMTSVSSFSYTTQTNKGGMFGWRPVLEVV